MLYFAFQVTVVSQEVGLMEMHIETQVQTYIHKHTPTHAKIHLLSLGYSNTFTHTQTIFHFPLNS